jgi:hypothetical protein
MTKVVKLSFLLFIISASFVQAQPEMIGYGLARTLPQANALNPALLPDYKFTLGLPGISAIYSRTDVNFMNAQTLMDATSGEVLDTDLIYNKLKKNNRIANNETISLFNIGFRNARAYSAFSVNTRVFTRVSLPRDLLTMALYGNASSQLDNGLVDLKNLSFKANSYTEVALSHGREILSGRMTVGARLKYLIGHGTADLKGVDGYLQSHGTDSITIVSNGFDARVGGIYPLLNDDDFDVMSVALGKNNGFAIDLGATYQFTHKISFSASLVDLGFISWKENNATYNFPASSYTFKGADLLDLIGDENEDDDGLDQELDSIGQTFEPTETVGGKFTTALTGKFYGGASYQLTERQLASAIVYAEMYKGKLIPALTAMYNFQLNTFFNFALSATATNGRVNNFGAGMTLNLAGFQFYVASNDVFSLVNPMKGRSVNVNFGLNLTYGNIMKGRSRGKSSSDNTIDQIDLGVD